MNLEHFIAQRLAFNRGGSFTKVIIFIAIAAIALSVAVMIISTSMIAGFKNEINNKIFGFWGNIHVSDANIVRNFDLKPMVFDTTMINSIRAIKSVEYERPRTFLNFDFGEETEIALTKGGVHHVHSTIVMPGLIEVKDGFQAILFKGTNSDFNWKSLEKFIIEGRPIQYLQDSATNEIVVSKILADKTQIIVGQKIIASFIKENAKLRRAFKVVGIYNTGLEEYDRRFVIGDMGKIRDVLGWQKNEVGTLEIAIDHAEDTDVITEYIYTNYLPNNLHAESIQNKFPNIFEWLKLQDVNEKVILQLMTLVAIINMITVLLILILERTHMIGVLKSLGATNFSIRKVFLYQAAYMVMFGLLIGNIIGLSLCLLQKYTAFIKLDESSYYLDKAPILIQPVNIGLINLTAFAVIVIFLSIPTLLINKISPVQALKFD